MIDLKEALAQQLAGKILHVDADSMTTSCLTQHPVMVLPNDFRLHDLENYLPQPKRIRRHQVLQSVESFVDYVREFEDDGTIVLFDIDHHKVMAILDYHRPDGKTAWCDHTATYHCQLTREWRQWIAESGRWLSQVDFAEFLEDHTKDVRDPDGAALLEIATNFRVVREATFKSGIRLNSGEIQFQYAQEDRKAGTVTLPENIVLGIRPFKEFDAYEVRARLRYRLNEGKLTLRYDLYRPEDVLEDAFKGIQKKIKAFIKSTRVFYGN